MNPDTTAEIGKWVTKAGLAGMQEPDLLKGFCQRATEAGLAIGKALLVVDTLHPVHEGRVFRWFDAEPDKTEVLEYGRTTRGGEIAENWKRSPFYHMLEAGESVRRWRLSETREDFPIFAELREAGQTELVALIDRFDENARFGEMDCIYSSFSTGAPNGFSESDLTSLKRLAPSLGLAVKSASLGRIAETLVEVYLGRDAGRRVLSGKIERGIADRIEAVLWFSDLRGFTKITDTSPPDTVIPLLNDYADAVISSIHDAGGDVLKLIGDGTLAIFTAETLGEACRCALKAEAKLQKRVTALNSRRQADGQPITGAYLGLNVGEVFYGNIGSEARLDFTVVGPAVNETSRIATMCRSIERDVLISAAFAAAAKDEDRDRLVCVGRYALRGVGQPQELFTLDPERPFVFAAPGGAITAPGGADTADGRAVTADGRAVTAGSEARPA